MMMMKSTALLALLLLAFSCANDESAPANNADKRQAIAVEYVRADELKIHARPSDDSPILATYSRGGSVSVLSRRGDWTEVRVADRSGWTHAASLASAAEAKKSEVDNLTPRFRVPPSPITSPGAHGEIILEASVNQDGEVIDVRTSVNTTGNADLASKNGNALRTARFEPIIQHGTRTPFTYEYRVHY
jgi:uncharacterized protein YgiM (DUF1202 family)